MFWESSVNFILNHIISIISIIVAIAVSYYFYSRTKRSKNITVVYSDTLLQSRSHPGVTILFEDRSIENLFSLQLEIINNGNIEVRKSDIPNKKPPRIQFADHLHIISGSVARQSNPSCDFSHVIQRENKCISFDFSHLNPSDGVTLEVLVDYQAGIKPPDSLKPEKNFSISGGLIGQSKIPMISKSDYYSEVESLRGLLVLAFFTISLFVGTVYLFASGHWGWGIPVLLFTISLIGMLFESVKKKLTHRVPSYP